MSKKRRSSQFKSNSKVIDMEEARRKRRARHSDTEGISSQRRSRSSRRAKASSPDRQELSGRQLKRSQSLRKKQVKRRLIIAGIVLILAILVGASVLNIVKLKDEQHQLLKQQEELQKEKQQLEDSEKGVGEDERVEEEARDKLKMVKPGETLYIPDEDGSSNNDSDEDGEDDE